MISVKVTRVGNSLGMVIPREILSDLGVTKGGTLFFTKATDGSVRLSAYDPEVARQIELGEQLMDEHKDVFRALAK